MRSLCFALLTMLAVPGYSKADSSAAVFGSFTSETRAIALSKDVATQLNIPTRVVEVQLNNQRLFRVMSEPRSTTAARNIVRAAKKAATQTLGLSGKHHQPTRQCLVLR